MSKRREPDTHKEADEPRAKHHKAAAIEAQDLVTAGASVLEAEFRAANEAAIKAAAEILSLYKDRDVYGLEVPMIKYVKREVGRPLFVQVGKAMIPFPRRKRIMAQYSFPVPSHVMNRDRTTVEDGAEYNYENLVLYDDLQAWWPRCRTDAERTDMAKYAETMANELAHVLVRRAGHAEVIKKIRSDAGQTGDDNENIRYESPIHWGFCGVIEIGKSIEKQEAVLSLICKLKDIV